MSRKAWLQLVLPLIGLSVLFWLLAFAPSEKHHQPPLLELSVILRDGDGAVSTMRKGMEQAAQDLNVELRFLIPAEDNSAVQQAQLLEREVAGAAPAVLLIPADREALGDAVSAAAGKTTLVTVETDMTAWGAAASITMDHQALGAALGAAALNGVPEGGTVLLLDSLPGDNGIRERMEAAKAVLEREGRQARVYKWDPDTTSLPDILRIQRPRAIIAFEAAALADVAELSRGEDAFPLLYGVWTVIHGQIIDWYPYWFIDIAALGWGRTMANYSLLLGFFLVLGLIVVALDRGLAALGKGDSSLTPS